MDQWVPAPHRGDAIGDSARRVRDLLRAKGHGADLFALTIDDDLRDDVRPFDDPAARRGDVTIFHYALPSPMTAAFATLPGGRVLQYHNITPAHFFAGYDANMFRLATIGRRAAVALIGRLKLSGFTAWAAWLGIHIFFLIGFRNRFVVLMEWALAYMTHQRNARLILEPPLAAGIPAVVQDATAAPGTAGEAAAAAAELSVRDERRR